MPRQGSTPPSSGGGAVASVAGKTGAVTLASTDLTDGTGLLTTTAANSTYARVSTDVSPALRGLHSDLTSGRSTAFGWRGDSTGTSDGVDPTTDTTSTRFARLLAAAYPAYHVISKEWNDALGDFTPAVVLQSQSAGPEFTHMSVVAMRYNMSNTYANGLDLRAKVNFDAFGVAIQTLHTSFTNMAGSNMTGMQFMFEVDTDGTPILAWSTNGTSWAVVGVCSASLTTRCSAGQDIRVRATLSIVPGTSYAAKFYTSTDGMTWTQLGATLSASGGTIAAIYAAGNSVPLFGASFWTSPGNPFIGKVYEIEIRDGINGPLLAPVLPRLWERYPHASTTTGGAPTLWLINAGHAATDMTYHLDAARMKLLTPDYGQTAEFFNDSHNEVANTGTVNWLTPYTSWVTGVQAREPRAAAVAILQNPHTSAWSFEVTYGISHQYRLAELAGLASKQGWGLVDLWSAYNSDPRGLSVLVSSDGLHPTLTGYILGAQTALRALGVAS